MRFAQPFEIEDGQGLRCLQCIAKELGNLLRNRSMLALGPSPKLPVEGVGQVLDIQDCHMILLSSSIMEEAGARIKAKD
jgi:hypothetical protein